MNKNLLLYLQIKKTVNMKKNLPFCIIAAVLVMMGCNNAQTNNSSNESDSLCVDSTEVGGANDQDKLAETQPKPNIININGCEAKLIYSFVTDEGIERDFYQVEDNEHFQLYFKEDAIKKTRRIETPYDRYNDNDDFYDNGFTDSFLYTTSPDGRYLYLVADIHANSNGWTREFQLYKIDCESLNESIIADCAAIKRTDEGFTTSVCRLANEDTATSLDDEDWVMHDVKMDWDGNEVFDDKDNEYDYDSMLLKYPPVKRDYWYVSGFDDADEIK